MSKGGLPIAPSKPSCALPVPDPPYPGGGVHAKFYMSDLYYVTYSSQ